MCTRGDQPSGIIFGRKHETLAVYQSSAENCACEVSTNPGHGKSKLSEP